MRTTATILFLLLLSFIARAQVIFKTTVQKSTVSVGESFFIQYILEDIEKNEDFTPPGFNGLRVVSGPNINNGKVNTPDGVKPVKNFTFTLVALKPGIITIHGARAKVNGHFVQSDDVTIEAVMKVAKYENGSEYFLQPGEDPYEKMHKNLFMKVMVDKKSCYVGEPVVATFKLYSRLQSKSDIVKNPGFYGFSVQDVVNLDNRVSNIETIDGKKFDVHTIRMVQLYPLQAGLFMIDAMEVLNKVEFSKSAVNKKAEQEIVEGFFENKEPPLKDDNTVVYENSISTEKIAIRVKSYPERNKPPVFNGATGNFTISIGLEKNDLAKNEEGDLIVTISGKGNFTQLPAPVIEWPAGMEGFEATIKDSLDKTHTPLKGTRTFRFPFVAARPGNYVIPGISFSFFDTDSNNYKTVSGKPVEIRVVDREKETQIVIQDDISHGNGSSVPWSKVIAIMALLTAMILWYIKKRKTGKPAQIIIQSMESPTAEEMLQPAYRAMEKNDSHFYDILQKAIWDYLGVTLNLSGSGMNKQDLQKALETKHLSKAQSERILGILQECEAAAFTKAEFIHDKADLLTRTKSALNQVKN
jgi:hypothetical protein